MSSPVQTPTARSFFSPRGMLSQWRPDYEHRPGQLEMAVAVEAAIEEKKTLLVEAGTGTGKTLAYLIPAILSGKRVVISTGTKNLQEQIYHKDIPFLQQHLARPLSVCYMKGRSNFACRRKIYEAERSPMLSGLEEISEFRVVREWEKVTRTGDRAELQALPENSSLWAKIDARRDMCTGQKCAEFERCFLTLMHQRAVQSDIIIVNHHLFFADLALKDEEFGQIIPEYSAVIFDEAHEIEDVAGMYFGISVSSTQLDDLRRDTGAIARLKNFGSAELDRILQTAKELGDRFFGLFPANEGRAGFRDHHAFLEQYHEQYDDFVRSVELIALQLSLIKNAPEEAIPLHRRAREYVERLRFWVESPQRSLVYWVERRARGVHLQATPIDVSPILEQKLFERVDTIILTSATLVVAGGFDFAQERLGLRHARSLIVESPFDYHRQALLYVPQHLPDPRNAAFTQAACEEIVRLLELSRGRAFVLFTSYQQMRLAYDRVSLEVEFPTLLQGSAPRTALLEEFRATPHAVLFATSSFWQGVDVQGEQLSCVIIDKLPFAVPSDPVVEARIRDIRDAGGEPFYTYQIPRLESLRGVNPDFTRIDAIRNSATSGYHSLQAQYNRRFRQGLQAIASYTFGKSLDTASEESLNNFQAPTTNLDPRKDRGPSTFDVRHLLSAAFSYELPAPRTALARTLLGGFGVDGILRARTAPPVNLLTGRDPFGLGFTTVSRPDLLPGIPLYLQSSTLPGGKRLNPAAFDALTPVAEGRQGNLGRNVMRGFGMTQLDGSLRRQFRITDTTNLQFRADGFNVLNRANFANPSGVLTSAVFGRATQMLGSGLAGMNPLFQVGGPRSFQLALKLQF